MKKLIVVLCIALVSCQNTPQKPLIVTGYKTSHIDTSNCERQYCVVDKSGVYYYFTDIINCSQPSKYMIGDTLK